MANIMAKSLLFDKINMFNRSETEFAIQKHHILRQFVIRRSLFRHIWYDKSYLNFILLI